MKRGRVRSESSLRTGKSNTQIKEEVFEPPLDTLAVKIKSLRVTSEDRSRYAIKVSFFDQLLLTGTITPIGAREHIVEKTIARGSMNYDSSDYEKMCLFADTPLVVHIQPINTLESCSSIPSPSLANGSCQDRSLSYISDESTVSCCNIDILPVFIETNKMRVTKRLEPMIETSVLHRQSWDNLPLLTMELEVTENPLNATHHNVLKAANYMKITLVACYNMLVPFDRDFIYTAASKSPISNDSNTGLITFDHGHSFPNRFRSTSFYPKWESLVSKDDVFTKGDEKCLFNIANMQTSDDIDIRHHLTHTKTQYVTVWSSFHRTLMLKNSEIFLWEHLRKYHWPLEIHMNGEQGGYSFMGFLDLFKLLYPGEKTVQLAIPLHWINSEVMLEKCGCELLLTPNEKSPFSPPEGTPVQKINRGAGDSGPTSTTTDITYYPRPTGADEGSAFVIVEVKLLRPLIKPSIPPHITDSQIKEMLREIENVIVKPECTGRGQLIRDWQSTVRSASNSLRRVPYYGMTELCAFNRQLSETRTRVELTTSCWQDAAIFVNNNFVVKDYLNPDAFEEMLMMAHACLMRSACDILVGIEDTNDLEPTLKAARSARQLQNIPHAMDLYMQLVTESYNNANSWRELSTCLMDVDTDFANVCINQSLVLNPRHPLTLLCKGSMLFEEDPESAELFFSAILYLHPLWTAGWVIVHTFYNKRQEYHLADQIMECLRKTQARGLAEDIGISRGWQGELGDWWDHTPLLPGMSRYFDAADLLLRIRGMALAEACIARALSETGESAACSHLVALSCRLRGDYDSALCHLHLALEKFGEVGFLRSLEAECFFKKNDHAAKIASFEKAGNCVGPYSILISNDARDQHRSRMVLVDLLRRQPSSAAWMALADDWMTRQSVPAGDGDMPDEQAAVQACATACAIQALKCDRRCARAWCLLARLVRPKARREHCRRMAADCGYVWSPELWQAVSESQQSVCHRVGRPLRECHCDLCEPIKF